MRVATINGSVYRIQFVHSAHDAKNPVEGLPGSLRQIVDNLATSLRRRVTLCEIGQEGAGLAYDPTTGTHVPGVVVMPLAYGFSVCHYFDQFVKAEGRSRSFHRALKNSKLDKGTREELLLALGL